MLTSLFKNAFSAPKHSACILDLKKGYQNQPRFSGYLPYLGFDSKHQVYVLEDGLSVASIFDINPLPMLTKNESQTIAVMEKMVRLLKTTLSFDAASPYYIQCYVFDDNDMSGYLKRLEDSIEPEIRSTAYTQDYLSMMREHMEFVTQPQGVFFDEMVTNNTFRAKHRIVRMIVYRRLNAQSKTKKGRTHIQAHNAEMKKLTQQLEANGISINPVSPENFIHWMRRWFSPKKSVHQKIPQFKDELPFGYDFSEQCLLSSPASCNETGVWYFDEMPHRLITVEYLFDAPKRGHISAEWEHSQGQHYTFLDKLPEGSIWVMNIVLQDNDTTLKHLSRIEKSAIGKRVTTHQVKAECEVASQLVKTEGLYPVAMGVYIRADNLDEFSSRETQLEAMLKLHDLAPKDSACEVAPLEAYLRFLPMNYHSEWDKVMRQSHYVTGEHVARLLPFYGAHKGSGNPTSQYFTRSGELVCFDKHKDKTMNGHLLVLGATGSGKSADAIYMMKSWLACYRPRLVIIEAGKSFNLFMDEAKALGLTTFDCILEPRTAKPLNVFHDAFKVLEQFEQREKHQSNDDARTSTDDENRDLFAEMVNALKLMITGGLKIETDAFRRHHMVILQDAILMAARNVREEGKDQVITQDVEQALRAVSQQLKEDGDSEGAKDAKRFADSVRQLLQEEFSNKIFNRPGEPLPDVDVIRIDLGLLKSEDKAAHMGLAFMGIMNRVMARAEANQYDKRMTEVVIDEAHIVMRNPYTVVNLIQCSKMSRKLGLWLNILTQNLQDFPDEAEKIISMMEHVKLLNTSKDEVKQIARFIPLTSTQKSLIESIKKKPRCYTEAVYFSKRQEFLYRSVPPRLTLALAMTEKDEKADRASIMHTQRCSELEAARVMARGMREKNEAAKKGLDIN